MSHPEGGSQKRQDKKQFSFINIDHPSDGRNKLIRREVRSHVTTQQHRLSREERRRRVADSTLSELNQPRSDSNTPSRPAPKLEGRGIKRGKSKSRPVVDNEEEEEPPDSSKAPLKTESDLRHDASTQLQDKFQQRFDGLLSVETILQSAPMASQTSRMNLLNDPSDRIANMLGRLRLNFPMVMEHYNWIVATQAVDFEKHFMENLEPGSGFQTLIPGISKDPALLVATVLIAVGHMLAIRNAAMSQNTARCIYEMRNFVIAHLNAAIQDPRRAISNPLLVAVMIIASHEGLQGSVENYHIHMKGLVQMINLRGGLDKLNESQTYLRELIVWQDTNVAAIMRCKPYHLLANNISETPACPPNPRMWLLMDATNFAASKGKAQASSSR